MFVCTKDLSQKTWRFGWLFIIAVADIAVLFGLVKGNVCRLMPSVCFVGDNKDTMLSLHIDQYHRECFVGKRSLGSPSLLNKSTYNY